MDWLLAPIDPSRTHEVGLALSWHGRSMVLAWGILAPLAVLAARFFKVLPWQDWPRELDTQLWWRAHWIGQSVVLALTLIGLVLVIGRDSALGLHGILGYAVLILVLAQVGFGIFRGTKGGPTAPAPDGSWRGDHYDMTPWRILFERVHKSFGYLLVLLASITVVYGIWMANAPVWMWLTLAIWWTILIIAFIILQRRGFAVDTYEAIWGPDPEHPGNARTRPARSMRRAAKERTPGE